MTSLTKFVTCAAVVCASVVFAAQTRLKLEYVLSGPAIAGVVPSGKAVIDQPRLPGQLKCEVQNVNLPDGTVLTVRVNFYNAGAMRLSGGKGQMQAPIPFQVGPGPFEILQGSTVIMTGRWKN